MRHDTRIPGTPDTRDPVIVGRRKDQLTTAASAADRALNNLSVEPDRWELTPFKNAQAASGNRNLFVDSPTAHEAFLVMFVITVFLSVVDALWYFINARREKSLEERLIESKFGELLSISYNLPNPAFKEEDVGDDETETETETETARLAPIKKGAEPTILKHAFVLICAEAYIDDPENNYLPTYALLIRVTESEEGREVKRYLVAKRVLAKGETFNEDEKNKYIKELLQQWKKEPPSFFESLNALRKRSSYMDTVKATLGFLYHVALWYWVVWFIAAGFVGFTGALTLAGGSPIIAFVIPVVVTIAWYLIKFIAAYRKGDFATNAAHAEKMNRLAEDLVKINVAANPNPVPEHAVVADTAETLQNRLSMLRARLSPEKIANASLKDKVANILQLKSHLDTSALSVVGMGGFRKYVTGARTYVAYFIIFSFLAWVFTDFLSVFGVVAASLSMASAIVLIVAPMIIALIGAVVFAKASYKEAADREEALKAKMEHENLNQKKEQFDHLVEEVKLRYAYLISQGFEDQIKGQLKLAELMQSAQTLGQKLYAGFSGVSTWIGSAGGGSLVARLFLGLFAALAQIGIMSTFSYTSAAFIVPVVLLALVWAGVSVANYYQQQRLQKLEQLAAQLNTGMAIYENANEFLKKFEKDHPTPGLSADVPADPTMTLDDGHSKHSSPGAIIPAAPIVIKAPPSIDTRRKDTEAADAASGAHALGAHPSSDDGSGI